MSSKRAWKTGESEITYLVRARSRRRRKLEDELRLYSRFSETKAFMQLVRVKRVMPQVPGEHLAGRTVIYPQRMRS
jgi:hypothetical protein